jgi:hypothetical protein
MPPGLQEIQEGLFSGQQYYEFQFGTLRNPRITYAYSRVSPRIFIDLRPKSRANFRLTQSTLSPRLGMHLHLGRGLLASLLAILKASQIV